MQQLATRLLRCSLTALSFVALTSVAHPRSAPILNAKSIAPAPSFAAPQFLRADRSGNVFLLRGDTLDVYPVSTGKVSPANRLQAYSLVGGTVSDAAMSADGKRWIVAMSNHLSVIEGREARSLPDVGWMVTSVAMLHDAPLAAVLPMSVGTLAAVGRPSAPPLLVRYGGTAWTAQVQGAMPKRSHDQDPMNALVAEHTVRLVTDAEDRVWAVYPYLGRVERFTPAGKPDLQIVVGAGTARYREDAAELQTAWEDKLRKQGYDTANATMGVFTAKLGIRGATVAPDGTFYMVLDASLNGGVTLLGRLDPSRGIVEGAPINLPNGGEMSLAVGKDGLYIAANEGDGGRWQLGWPSIASANWRELRFVKLSNS